MPLQGTTYTPDTEPTEPQQTQESMTPKTAQPQSAPDVKALNPKPSEAANPQPGNVWKAAIFLPGDPDYQFVKYMTEKYGRPMDKPPVLDPEKPQPPNQE